MQQEGTSNKYQGLQRRAPRSSCCYEVMLRQPADTQTDKQTNRQTDTFLAGTSAVYCGVDWSWCQGRGKGWCWCWGGRCWCWGGGSWGGRPLRPERRHTLCASLRSGNALQCVTRATPYGIFLYKYLIKFNPFHTISVVNPISSSNSIRPIYNLYVIP